MQVCIEFKPCRSVASIDLGKTVGRISCVWLEIVSMCLVAFLVFKRNLAIKYEELIFKRGTFFSTLLCFTFIWWPIQRLSDPKLVPIRRLPHIRSFQRLGLSIIIWYKMAGHKSVFAQQMKKREFAETKIILNWYRKHTKKFEIDGTILKLTLRPISYERMDVQTRLLLYKNFTFKKNKETKMVLYPWNYGFIQTTKENNNNPLKYTASMVLQYPWVLHQLLSSKILLNYQKLVVSFSFALRGICVMLMHVICSIAGTSHFKSGI